VKILAIAITNLRRFVRDRSNAFFVFILPLGIVILIGAQFGGDFTPRIGLHVSDPADPVAAAIAEDLRAEEGVVIESHDDVDEMTLEVERGNIAAGVVIPEGVEETVSAGQPAEIGFVSRQDGFGPQFRSVVDEAAARAVQPIAATRFAVDRGAEPEAAAAAASQVVADLPEVSVEVTTTGESLFPTNIGQFDIGASSQLVLFMFLTGLSGSAALIQSRNLGVSTRMAGTPTSTGTIIAGEALGRFVIVLVQGLYIMGATVLLFQVNWGDPLGAAALVLAFSVVGAGAAMLFGAVFRNDQQAGGIAVLAGLGLAALGGSMLPIELFSDTMRSVARFTPHAWALEGFAELVRRDGTIADILPELGVLLAMGAGLLLIAAWRMRVVLTRA
jgi:ABC-2 type transport system permease protein